MSSDVINFKEKFSKFNDYWSPKIIAQMNDYHFKLVKVQGHFTWHDHKDTDEVFIVLQGKLQVDFEDGNRILEEGEMIVVPKGLKHKPYAEKECKILVVEPKGVINTGESGGSQTAPNDVWI